MDERFRMIAELSPVAIFEADAEGRCVFVNALWCELTGLTLEEARGAGWMRALHPDDLPTISQGWAAAVRENRIGTGDFRYVRRGETVWVRASGRAIKGDSGEVIGYFGAVVDITATRRAEEEARAREIELRTFFDALPDGVIVEDQGRILHANPALARLIGYENPSLLMEVSAVHHVHPADRESVLARLRQEYPRGGAIGPSHFRIVRLDGSVVDVEAYGSLAVIGGRQVNVGVLRDVTQRLELERRVRSSERMATLGAVAAGIIHEISSPLSTMLLNCEEMRQALDRNTPESQVLARQCLADTQLAATHLRKIVSEIRRVARGERDEASVVDVARALETASTLARFEMHGLRYEREVDAGLRVMAREQALVQALVNLLVNAAQARHPDRAHEVSVRVTRDGKHAQFVIADTGTGMDEETRARLFEPFFTSKTPDVGTGMGLLITRNLVKEMDGRIHIESTLGQGTQVRLRVPLAGA